MADMLTNDETKVSSLVNISQKNKKKTTQSKTVKLYITRATTGFVSGLQALFYYSHVMVAYITIRQN